MEHNIFFSLLRWVTKHFIHRLLLQPVCHILKLILAHQSKSLPTSEPYMEYEYEKTLTHFFFIYFLIQVWLSQYKPTCGILFPQASKRWDVCPPADTRRLWGWGTACTRRWQPSRLSLCLHPTGEKRCLTSEWARPRTQPWSERAAFCQSASLCWDCARADHCRFPCSGTEVLRYSDVSFEMLASCFPEILSPYMEFAQRLKIEGD